MTVADFVGRGMPVVQPVMAVSMAMRLGCGIGPAKNGVEAGKNPEGEGEYCCC